MKNREVINITGAFDSRSAFVISEILKKNKENIIITATEREAVKLAGDLSFFSEREIPVFPAEEEIFLSYSAKNRDDTLKRLGILEDMRKGKSGAVIVPASAFLKKVMPADSFRQENFEMALGDQVDPAELAKILVSAGYERTELVNAGGQFAIRGGITDIFVSGAENPYRIEFFGDEVDGIRSFDVESQRSLENLNEIQISPADQFFAEGAIRNRATEKIEKEYSLEIDRLIKKGKDDTAEKLRRRKAELTEYIASGTNRELLENYVDYFFENPETLFDYTDGAKIIIDNPKRVQEHLKFRQEELMEDFKVLQARGMLIPDDFRMITGWDDLVSISERTDVTLLQPFRSAIEGFETFDRTENLDFQQVLACNGNLDAFEKELKNYSDRGYEIHIVSETEERRRSLMDFVHDMEREITVIFDRGGLSEGFEVPFRKKVYFSDGDIFPQRRVAYRKRKKKRSLSTFAEMKKGDYVVHENHGIGKFTGIETMKIQGEEKDYIRIRYAGTDVLYIPTEQMDMVQKYIGSEGNIPKLSSLSSNEWKVTKAKAKASIEDMADELITLYSGRTLRKGYAFSKDTVWQKEFEDSFPYELTEDQQISTDEIKADMEKPFPMERLLCGDVGFGKTEVAARAVFKCLADGKQAAMLVPTTLLANQHYNTLKERFEAFPINMEMLSRFRSKKEQAEIIRKLKAGEMDFVIGTHRLLSSDVNFKDAGLLVIDEEQRFGVKHKEKIKQLKENVDVLTLSATPIPRTLNMSLTGIRDMSLIEEAPGNRYPVKTYVSEEDDVVLREIIERELRRGGQVFVVYNRVSGINGIADKISQLVPEAKVTCGHGRMSETQLEKMMMEFIEGETNVMVATTIIESGIDIPNANTMIVLDSDRYGLSQLYQLKGRVGRSDRIAYAYFMYRKNKVLSEVASKRLKAIKEFTEFGSGFKIAMRDLEIRGAGNLLGKEQSGHMMNIGYELYCKLMEDAVKRAEKREADASGITAEDIAEVDRSSPFDEKESGELEFDIQVSANIPTWYIGSETLKLEMYKKIAQSDSKEDADDIIDEMYDRFGEIPKETLNLINMSLVRTYSRKLGLEKIRENRGRVVFDFEKENGLSGFALMNAGDKFGKRIFFHGGVKPYVTLACDKKRKLEEITDFLGILFDNRKGENNAV